MRCAVADATKAEVVDGGDAGTVQGIASQERLLGGAVGRHPLGDRVGAFFGMLRAEGCRWHEPLRRAASPDPKHFLPITAVISDQVKGRGDQLAGQPL